MRIAVLIAGALAVPLSFASAWALTPHWQTYAPDHAGFTVEMPDKPTLKDEVRKGRATYSAVVSFDKSVAGADLVFIVKYQTAQGNPGPDADAILNQVVKAMSEGGKLIDNEKQTVGGFPARQFSFRDADGDTFMVRLALTDHAFLETLYSGPLNNPLGKKFIASLAVTKK